MKPVMQSSPNNCFPACVASILGYQSSETMPNWCFEYDDWMSAFREWLKPKGLGYIECRYADEEGIGQAKTMGYHVIIGDGARGQRHSVVGCSGRIVHDPFPGGCGLLGSHLDWDYGYFVLLDPSRG